MPPSLTKAGEIRQDRWVSLSALFFFLLFFNFEASKTRMLFILFIAHLLGFGVSIEMLVAARLVG